MSLTFSCLFLNLLLFFLPAFIIVASCLLPSLLLCLIQPLSILSSLLSVCCFSVQSNLSLALGLSEVRLTGLGQILGHRLRCVISRFHEPNPVPIRALINQSTASLAQPVSLLLPGLLSWLCVDHIMEMRQQWHGGFNPVTIVACIYESRVLLEHLKYLSKLVRSAIIVAGYRRIVCFFCTCYFNNFIITSESTVHFQSMQQWWLSPADLKPCIRQGCCKQLNSCRCP